MTRIAGVLCTAALSNVDTNFFSLALPQVKKQYDSHTWKAEMTGEYRACFSNEFSTFSHKLVYIDFQVGEEKPLPGLGDHLTAMTQVTFV